MMTPIDLFSIFFRYFWFIAAVVGALNMIIGRYRLSSTLKQHPEWEEEANQFLKGYFFISTVPVLFLAMLQLAGGYNNPLYIISGDINLYTVLSWCVLLITWTIVFHYVFFQDGARTLVKFRAIGNIPANETYVKVMVVVMLVAGLCVLISGVAYGMWEDIFPPGWQ